MKFSFATIATALQVYRAINVVYLILQKHI